MNLLLSNQLFVLIIHVIIYRSFICSEDLNKCTNACQRQQSQFVNSIKPNNVNVTGPAKIVQVGIWNFTTIFNFVASQLKVCSGNYNEITIINERLNMNILKLTESKYTYYKEPIIFNILWLRVYFVPTKTIFTGPVTKYYQRWMKNVDTYYSSEIMQSTSMTSSFSTSYYWRTMWLWWVVWRQGKTGVCVCISIPRLLVICGVMWYDMDPLWMVEDLLVIHSNCSWLLALE